MLHTKRNYETHNIELLEIVESYKTWCYYLVGAAYTILVLTNLNKLKKFMKTTRPRGRQI